MVKTSNAYRLLVEKPIMKWREIDCDDFRYTQGKKTMTQLD
jgi:hypothetical protein